MMKSIEKCKLNHDYSVYKNGVRYCKICKKNRDKRYKITKSNMIWSSMKQRCYNPKDKGYKNYGGRGITICEDWISDSKNFIRDMGEPPFVGASIDRIDNDGPYSKENCRWATRKTQSRNRRSNIFIEYDGEKMILPDIAKKLGISIYALKDRIYRGMPVEKALSFVENPRNRYIEAFGERLRISEWAERCGVSYSLLKSRIKRGWKPEKAVSTPSLQESLRPR